MASTLPGALAVVQGCVQLAAECQEQALQLRLVTATAAAAAALAGQGLAPPVTAEAEAETAAAAAEEPSTAPDTAAAGVAACEANAAALQQLISSRVDAATAVTLHVSRRRSDQLSGTCCAQTACLPACYHMALQQSGFG